MAASVFGNILVPPDPAAAETQPDDFVPVAAPSASSSVFPALSRPIEPAPAFPAPQMDDFVNVPQPHERTFVERTIVDPTMRGLNQTTMGARALAAERGIISPESAAEGITGDVFDMRQYPVQPESQQFRDELADESFLGAAKQLVTNPGDTWQLIAEQSGNLVTSTVAGLVGSAVGSIAGSVVPGAGTVAGRVAGGIAGQGVAAYGQEYSYAILEQLQTEGVPQTAEAIAAALSDPGFLERASERGHARGVPVGVAAAISSALIGRVAGPVAAGVTSRLGDSAASGVASRVAGLGAETAVQAGVDTLGEVGAQLNADGEITSPSDVAVEGLLGVPGAVAELPQAIFNQPARSLPTQDEAPMSGNVNFDNTRQEGSRDVTPPTQEGRVPPPVSQNPESQDAPSGRMETAIDPLQDNASRRVDLQRAPTVRAEAQPETPTHNADNQISTQTADQPSASPSVPVQTAAPEQSTEGATVTPSTSQAPATPGVQETEVGQPDRRVTPVEPPPLPADSAADDDRPTALTISAEADALPQEGENTFLSAQGPVYRAEAEGSPPVYFQTVGLAHAFVSTDPSGRDPRRVEVGTPLVQRALGAAPFTEEDTQKLLSALPDTDTGGATEPESDVTPPPLPTRSESFASDPRSAPEQSDPPPLETKRTHIPKEPFEQNDRSRSRDVWEAMGEDPGKAELLPANQQLEKLGSHLKSAFGFKTITPRTQRGRQRSTNTQDAVSQLKDAQRALSFMSNALNIPAEAMGLSGRVGLQIDRGVSRGALGMYTPGNKTIALRGRSNFFAHEWAHALDHYLSDRLNNLGSGVSSAMFTRAVRGGSLIGDVNRTNPIEQAFVDVLNTLFFDDAELAARVIKLSASKAKDAQKQLERILAGASRARGIDSSFRGRVKLAAGNKVSYFANAPEMFARAFEFYLAHRLSQNGDEQGRFTTMPFDAYDSENGFGRFFPNATEQAQVIKAFDALFAALTNQAFFGNAATAVRPDAENLFSLANYRKLTRGTDETFGQAVHEEFKAIARGVANFQKQGIFKGMGDVLKTSTALSGIPKNRQRSVVRDTLRGLLYSIRGRLGYLEKANKDSGGQLIGFVRDMIATRPGENRSIGLTYEEEHERVIQSFAADIDAQIKRLKLGDRVLGGLKKEHVEPLRKLLLGVKLQDIPGVSPSVVELATFMRNQMDDVYAEARKVGIDLGYVSDTGFLTRIYERVAVSQDRDGFLAAASQAYEHVYQRDLLSADVDEILQETRGLVAINGDTRHENYAPEVVGPRRALEEAVIKQRDLEGDPNTSAQALKAAEKAVSDAKDQLIAVARTPWSERAARNWHQAFVTGDANEFTTVGPTDTTKPRTMTPEADEIMRDYLVTDPLAATMQYVHAMAQRTAYVRRVGVPGGNKDIDAVMQRPANAAYQNDPRFNRTTEEGVFNIISELTDKSQDNLVEMSLVQAGKFGMSEEHTKEVRGLFETVTGRLGGGFTDPSVSRFSSAIYIYTLITLLPRAMWTAASEPLAVLARTGSVPATAATFVAYGKTLGQFIKQSNDTQDLVALSKALGIIATPLYDNVLLNRMSADFDQPFSGEKLMARFFQANLLTPMTNAQRQAVLRGGYVYISDLARIIADPEYAKKSGAKVERAEAALRELGISDTDMGAFADYVQSKMDGYIPQLDALDDDMGKLWGDAAARFVNTTVMNPQRVDKMAWTMAPSGWGRVIGALTSFIWKFTQEIHVAAAKRYSARRDMGDSRLEAAGGQLAQFGAGFALLAVGQLAQTTLREFIFSQERWQEMEEEEELRKWLMRLAVSRTGVAGPLDIIWNSLTGLRYERDLTSLTAGAGLGYALNNLANIINGVAPNIPLVGDTLQSAGLGGRNSNNTLSAENTAVKSAYRMIAVPGISFMLSSIPIAGPVGRAVTSAGLQYGTSASPASAVADAIVPE